MKKYLSFYIISLSFLFSTALVAKVAEDEIKVVTASIEASDLVAVKNFIAWHTLNGEEKKELLEKAITTFKERAQKIKLLRSPWDLAKLMLGTTVTSVGSFIGAAATGVALQEGVTKLNWNLQTCLVTLSIPFSLGVGVRLMAKGWRCSTATDLCKNAEDIKKLIEAASVFER